MDIVNLLIGILITILGIVLNIFQRERFKKVDKKDYMRRSFKVEISTGIFIITICGIVMILRELF